MQNNNTTKTNSTAANKTYFINTSNKGQFHLSRYVSVLMCPTNRACASGYERVGVWARCTKYLPYMEVLIDGQDLKVKIIDKCHTNASLTNILDEIVG